MRWKGEHELHNRQQDPCSRHVAEKVAPTRTARIALARRGKDHICSKNAAHTAVLAWKESDISARSTFHTRSSTCINAAGNFCSMNGQRGLARGRTSSASLSKLLSWCKLDGCAETAGSGAGGGGAGAGCDCFNSSTYDRFWPGGAAGGAGACAVGGPGAKRNALRGEMMYDQRALRCKCGGSCRGSAGSHFTGAGCTGRSSSTGTAGLLASSPMVSSPGLVGAAGPGGPLFPARKPAWYTATLRQPTTASLHARDAPRPPDLSPLRSAPPRDPRRSLLRSPGVPKLGCRLTSITFAPSFFRSSSRCSTESHDGPALH